MNILPCFFVPQKHIRLHNNRHLLSPLLVPLYQEFLVDPREEHECYYWTALVRCLSSIIPLTLCVSLGTWGVGACVWGWPPHLVCATAEWQMESWTDMGRAGESHKWGEPARKTSLGQMKDEKLPELWRISNQDMETSHQLAKEVSPRGGKGSSIKHVGWALQDGMDMGDCCLFWILEIFLSVKQDRFSFKEIS